MPSLRFCTNWPTPAPTPGPITAATPVPPAPLPSPDPPTPAPAPAILTVVRFDLQLFGTTTMADNEKATLQSSIADTLGLPPADVEIDSVTSDRRLAEEVRRLDGHLDLAIVVPASAL